MIFSRYIRETLPGNLHFTLLYDNSKRISLTTIIWPAKYTGSDGGALSAPGREATAESTSGHMIGVSN